MSRGHRLTCPGCPGHYPRSYLTDSDAWWAFSFSSEQDLVGHPLWDPQEAFSLGWEESCQLWGGGGGIGASDLDSKDWKLSGKKSIPDGDIATSLGHPWEGRQDPAGGSWRASWRR